MSHAYYIGWDVGGWHCDKNSRSRDAIVVLDAGQRLVGEPWRGNLRGAIEQAGSSREFLEALFAHCHARAPAGSFHVTLGIDTPLAFSEAFVGLVTEGRIVETGDQSSENRYLYRATERQLAAAGKTPLSAIKDMLGSQATKGIHVLAKFAPQVEITGVWTDGQCLRAFETYPAVCRRAAAVLRLTDQQPVLHPGDLQDALVCAAVAYLLAVEPDVLLPPGSDIPRAEGWIWRPAAEGGA